MGVRDLVDSQLTVIGKAKLTVNSAATSNFDFGTPDDINLASVAGYRAGDRLLVVFDSTTTGTTNAISFSVQDADDNAGSIGTPATAVTDGVLTGGTGDQVAHTMVQVQPGRPWIRCRATGVGATDTHTAKVMVFAVPRGAL